MARPGDSKTDSSTRTSNDLGGPRMTIRRYQRSDLDAVSRVCLLTAAAGGDATGAFVDDELMPEIWARPYLAIEPEWAWVVAGDDGAVSGYILAAPDTRGFVERYRAEWLPRLSARYTRAEPALTPDDRMRELGFTPERMLVPEVDEYPAHLHIDLLPHLQGRGLGRQLIDTLEHALGDAGVPGLHLSLDPANTGALAFYRRLGFGELESSTVDEPLLGKKLPL